MAQSNLHVYSAFSLEESVGKLAAEETLPPPKIEWKHMGDNPVWMLGSHQRPESHPKYRGPFGFCLT